MNPGRNPSKRLDPITVAGQHISRRIHAGQPQAEYGIRAGHALFLAFRILMPFMLGHGHARIRFEPRVQLAVFQRIPKKRCVCDLASPGTLSACFAFDFSLI